MKTFNVKTKIFHFIAPCVLTFALVGAALFALSSLSNFHAHAKPLESRTIQNVIVNLAPQTITLTGSQTITPTLSFLVLEPSTTLTITLGEGIEGDQLLLISDVTTNTIVLTPNTTLASNATLAEDDVLKFTYVGDKWVDEYTADN